MSFVILHLSDIHIRGSSDEVLRRAAAIARSMFRYLPAADALFLVVSGDVAWSGERQQYRAAEKFLYDIVDRVITEKELPWFIFVTPGNHDCDFSKGDSVRDAVIDVVLREGEEAVDDERVTLCTRVQEAFQDFREEVQPHPPVSSDSLWTQYEVTVGGVTILFDCVNVSWMSKLPEVPGHLVFPVERYRHLQARSADLRILTLHHPLNWYHQTTYHNFRALIRNAADMILTGHEHVPGAAEIDDALARASAYLEGSALQPHSIHETSGFNVVEVDLDEKEYKCDLFEWKGVDYEPQELVGAWSSYRKLPARRPNEFELSQSCLDSLDDPGANFRHPGKQRLLLSDFYVFPDLEEVVEDGMESRLVNANVLRDPDALGRGTIVKGEEKSGKTALVRTLYRSYYEAGFVPVLLPAYDISSVSDRQLRHATEAAFCDQYSSAALEKWRNLPMKRKILLLDDYDKSKVADRFRHKVITFAVAAFGHVLITVDETLELHEATSADTVEALQGFGRYEIRPFGYKLRYDLISRWSRIGDDYARSSGDLTAQVDRTEKVINSVLGKNLVPRVPIYLLTLLQSLESTFPGEIQNSAFGYYYQYLITQSLREVSVRPDELEEFFHYCSQLAWIFHEQSSREMRIQELRGFNAAYSEKYFAIDSAVRVQKLCDARLLKKRGEVYSFSYPYIYYFFLGKYLAERLTTDQEVRGVVERCCVHLYVREYANIILFLTHHSRENFIIQCVVDNLRCLFADKEPICLEEDTSTLNDLVESTSRLVFAGGEAEANRRKQRELQDKVEEVYEEEQDSLPTEDELSADLDLPSRLNSLFKTVEFLGQILKNYYGTLPNAEKVDLMREVYLGPLRALREFLEFIEEDREALIREVELAMEGKAKRLEGQDRERRAKETLFEFVGLVTFGFIFRASSAVGSEHLREIAGTLVRRNPSTAFRLIELATRLDAPTTLPFKDIKALSASTSQNIFAHRLLETVVLRHLYLFRTEEKEKQQICDILGVSMRYQRGIDVRTKGKKLLK
jgi:hypothetical protein